MSVMTELRYEFEWVRARFPKEILRNGAMQTPSTQTGGNKAPLLVERDRKQATNTIQEDLFKMNVDDKYLTIREVSEMTKMSVATMYQWVHRRRIPYAKMGSRLRFSHRELTQWMMEHNAHPQDENA
jgi:excisionase family DNA binding protein